MEKSKRELEALVSSQKEQLSRYEKRLKDVVTAYKGLLKEKEALETSLSAITATKPGTDADNDGTTVTTAAKESSSRRTSISSVHSETSSAAAAATTSNTEQDKSHMQTQIITLMNSLATLSAEKSRMEASFQADKKQLRAQLLAKEQTIAELQNSLKENEERNKQKVEEVKAKWIIERQEREKETNNQMLMIRELQKLYADERHLKENIEMQLNNFKTQFASNEAENTRLNELQAQLKEAKQQLKQMQNSGTLNAAVAADESNALLRQLQQEMQQLKDQHAIAIYNEQRRVLRAEELSRKQAALHEDRVANLEARLAELSTSVGTYDRLRQQDQDSIHALKKKLQELELCAENIASSSHDTTIMRANNSNMSKPQDLSTIVEEIMRLKKLLLNENSQLPNPIDLSKVFDIGANHVDCQEDLNALQQQLDSVKSERSQLLEKTNVQSTHIATLQEKVKVLNRNIEEQELELKHYNDKLRSTLKDERTKWKERINEIENEYRCKVNDLEQQLQKQRQRSLQLLDEKEQEIKTLQTSFEIFHNATSNVVAAGSSGGGSMRDQTGVAAEMTQSSDAESMEGGNKVEPNKLKIKSKRMSIGENCHMLHYANELARKEIEIVALRKAKYTAETSLRKAIQDKVAAQEELSDRIGCLEEEVDRLERCKTREGANLEYLKNVIISFMTTKDVEGKRHMLNAISAVLQFTDSEIQTIHNAFLKK